MKRVPLWSAFFLGLALSVTVGRAENEIATSPDLGRQVKRIHLQSGREVWVFPAGFLVSPAIADPHRPGSAILTEIYTSTGIEGASDLRFLLKAGGRFGLFRWLPKVPDGRMWQISLEAGLDAQFDIDNRQDNVGWDGNYGLSLSGARPRSPWSFLVGVLHTSAHIGDEWVKRTGRQRINYTREEVRGVVARKIASRWRTYLEAGYAYRVRDIDRLMEPFRVQIGLEYESPETLWEGLAGWYLALDAQSWEERNWRLDGALQGGLMVTSAGRTWRLGLQYYDGRVPLGEFFQATESGFSFGLWSEL